MYLTDVELVDFSQLSRVMSSAYHRYRIWSGIHEYYKRSSHWINVPARKAVVVEVNPRWAEHFYVLKIILYLMYSMFK
jgi:hypothetical protein